jgi:hypothetical protein
MKTYITNLPNFIGLYKFCLKYDFHKFLQKLHEFYVMVNMNNICTYSIFLNIQINETFFFNDICECSCLIQKNI